MAVSYIGTGDGWSKENALTIENFADLRQVNSDTSNAGKYVKLLNDINVSEESWYMGSTDGWNDLESTPHYMILCRFFADSDSPKTIRGLTVSNLIFLCAYQTNYGSNKPGFEYVNLIDCCFKANSLVTNRHYLFGGLNLNQCSIAFDHSNVSILVVDNTATMYLFSNNSNSVYSITDSTFYIKHKPNTTRFSVVLDTYSTITRSTIILDGFSIYSHLSTSGEKSSCGLFRNTGKKISSAVIYRNCTFSTLAYNGKCYWLYQSSEGNANEMQSYYAFDNCTFVDGYPLAVWGSVSSRMVASNYQGTAFTHDVSSTSVADATILATMVDSSDPTFNTTSIKSQQFLIDNGFLP